MILIDARAATSVSALSHAMGEHHMNVTRARLVVAVVAAIAASSRATSVKKPCS